MLKPRKKMVKKELKKDPLLVFITRAENWYLKYKKYLMYGVSAFLVLFLVVILMINSKKKAEQEASTELGIAMTMYENGDFDNSLLKLLELTDKYSGTHSGNLALFYTGKIYLQKLDISNAEEFFQKAVDELDQDELIYPSALANLAFCKEKKGDYNLAAELYLQAANITPHRFLKEEYLLNAIGNYIEVMNYQKAKELLSRIERRKLQFNLRNSYDFYQAILNVKG